MKSKEQLETEFRRANLIPETWVDRYLEENYFYVSPEQYDRIISVMQQLPKKNKRGFHLAKTNRRRYLHTQRNNT